MITKVQDKTLTGELGAARGLRLSSLERAMLRWAVILMTSCWTRMQAQA